MTNPKHTSSDLVEGWSEAERNRLIDRIEALEAENERLRGALGDVTDYGDLAAVRIARAALEARHD